MGWGAAEAFYAENSSWLDSVEDAHDHLYPAPPKPRPPSKWACHLCGNKRLREPHSLRSHLRDKHKLTWEDADAIVSAKGES